MSNKLLVLGAGAAGTMCANMLRKKLKESDWSITIIDQDDRHIYQPGLLFIPFGVYSEDEIVRTRSEFLGRGIDFVVDELKHVDPKKKIVKTESHSFSYDKLIIATGVDTAPAEIDGMMDGWNKSIFEFYNMDGSIKLAKAMREFQGGRMILDIAELPYKCPVAPLEFVYMADYYFHQRGIRDKVEICLATPLASAFTKPKASAYFSVLMEEKNIKIIPEFELIEIDAKDKKMISVKGDEEPFDLLVSIPPHQGPQYLIDSGVSMDEVGYMRTDKHTLKAVDFDDVYCLGDGTNIPTSKAGSVAHFSAEVMVDNLLREISGEAPKPEFDGHSNCFIETGFDKGCLIDFNYEIEPLPGKFPLPGLGPFTLLGESKANHWGKMMFKWVYWNKLMQGDELPLEAQMSMAGKNQD